MYMSCIIIWKSPRYDIENNLSLQNIDLSIDY